MPDSLKFSQFFASLTRNLRRAARRRQGNPRRDAGLINPEAPKLDRLVALISEVGDESARQAAAARLVRVAEEVSSKAWLDRKTPALQGANRQSGLQVEPQQFALQLQQYQQDFVGYCVQPAIEAQPPTSKKSEEKKESNAK